MLPTLSSVAIVNSQQVSGKNKDSLTMGKPFVVVDRIAILCPTCEQITGWLTGFSQSYLFSYRYIPKETKTVPIFKIMGL